MGLHPYCIVPAGHEPPSGLAGLFGKPVRPLGAGPFLVWASEAETPPRQDLDSISAHHAVVVAAMDRTTPLPVRFGGWSAGDGELVARIVDRRDELAEALETVRGRIEFGVRILEADRPEAAAPEPPEAPYRDGRTYLRELARRQAVQRERRVLQDELTERLHRSVERFAHDERVRPLEAPGLVACAHLVHRGDEERYRSAVRAFAHAVGAGCRVHVTGPWPPYSFTS